MNRNIRVVLGVCGICSLAMLLTIASQVGWTDPKDKETKDTAPAKELVKARADLLASQKALAKTQADLAATQQLLAKKGLELVASQKEAQQAKADVTKTKAQQTAAEKNLTETKLALGKAQKEVEALTQKQKDQALASAAEAKKQADLLKAKDHELVFSRTKLAEAQGVQKDLRADLTFERDLHKTTVNTLAFCLGALFQKLSDAEDQTKVLAKTETALKLAEAREKGNKEKLETTQKALTKLEGVLAATRDEAKASLAKEQAALNDTRAALNTTKNELVLRTKALTETQASLLRTRLELQNAAAALKKTETAYGAYRKQIRDENYRDQRRQLSKIKEEFADLKRAAARLGQP